MCPTSQAYPLPPTFTNLADWYVKLYERATNSLVSEYSLLQPQAEIRNSEPGGFSGELALSQKRRGSLIQGMTTDEFASYATNYELYRQSSGAGVCISAGMLTSMNFNKDRDTVLIAGKDWIHYLERRIYPFDPQLYISGGWTQWPRQWPDVRGAFGSQNYNDPSPVDVGFIVRQLLQSMLFEPPTEINAANFPLATNWPTGAASTFGVPAFTVNVPTFGEVTKYKIFPGDATTIYDHVRKLSEQSSFGFEFDIDPITLAITVYPGRRDSGALIYSFFPSDDELVGQIVEFDWTNEGPEGTYLVGLASRDKRIGDIWTDLDNVQAFGRLDKVYDYGEISNSDLVLEMLKDQNDLHPQKKLQLSLFNPEFLALNFYTGGRPRGLIGLRVRVIADFDPLHTVFADFRINALNFNVDSSTNETVALELEMVYEP